MTEHLVIYARYSDEQQRATSIDDQIRRCYELAAQYGLCLDSVRVYKDSAVTGKAAGETKRSGFQQLLADWDHNAFTVLLVDEFSRLSRDVLTQAQLIRRLESSQRVRLLTANGIDTMRPNWQLQVGLEGIVSQQAGRDTKHRVVRGMVGQLERGYMIAAPAFGYSLKREFDGQANRIGSHWLINEAEASIVRDIFERRARGESMHEIAKGLNDRGVATQRKALREDGGFWRPSGVRRLLTNTIYKGVFVWNGSTSAQMKAEKEGRVLEPKTYQRPELRLVSDELWLRCNEKTISRSGYGGGRHALAGLATCGYCGSILAVSSARRCRSLYCARCTVAKHVDAQTDRLTGTVATVGFQHLLIEAARLFLSEPFIAAFRESLREKLVGGIEGELHQARIEQARLEGVQERLSRLIVSTEGDDSMLIARYTEARDRARAGRAKVDALMSGLAAVDHKAIAAQLEVADPLSALDFLFEADVPPPELRAMLARLFPAIVFEKKLSCHQSIFRIRFAPGVALAIASDTPTVGGEEAELRFLLRYWSGGNRGVARWTVEQFSEGHALDVRASVPPLRAVGTGASPRDAPSQRM